MTATVSFSRHRGPPATRHLGKRRTSALWLALPLVVLVAMRGDTRDTAQYIDVFRATTQFPWHPFDYYSESGMEWGYGILSWVLVNMGLGPTTLFFIVSAATFFFIDRTAHRVGMTFYAVMPYYLGTFFLTQQLMQIRQGLGIVFSFWIVVSFVLDARRPWRLAIGAGAAAMMHVVSLLPIISGLLLRRWLPASRHRRPRVPRHWRIAVWTAALIAVCVLLARAATTLQVFDLFERLSVYAADDEYSGARGLFEPANVRAVLVLALLLLACAARRLARSRVYLLLLGIYAVHVGLRLGFLDFEILSGRLSTALGFAEVFLLPMAVHACIRARSLRVSIAVIYLLVHAVSTLVIQTPYLIDDYFTPLHADYASR